MPYPCAGMQQPYPCAGMQQSYLCAGMQQSYACADTQQLTYKHSSFTYIQKFKNSKNFKNSQSVELFEFVQPLIGGGVVWTSVVVAKGSSTETSIRAERVCMMYTCAYVRMYVSLLCVCVCMYVCV